MPYIWISQDKTRMCHTLAITRIYMSNPVFATLKKWSTTRGISAPTLSTHQRSHKVEILGCTTVVSTLVLELCKPHKRVQHLQFQLQIKAHSYYDRVYTVTNQMLYTKQYLHKSTNNHNSDEPQILQFDQYINYNSEKVLADLTLVYNTKLPF